MKCENIREGPRDELLALSVSKIASIQPPSEHRHRWTASPAFYWIYIGEGRQYSTPRLVPLHSFAFFFHESPSSTFLQDCKTKSSKSVYHLFLILTLEPGIVPGDLNFRVINGFLITFFPQIASEASVLVFQFSINWYRNIACLLPSPPASSTSRSGNAFPYCYMIPGRIQQLLHSHHAPGPGAKQVYFQEVDSTLASCADEIGPASAKG